MVGSFQAPSIPAQIQLRPQAPARHRDFTLSLLLDDLVIYSIVN